MADAPKYTIPGELKLTPQEQFLYQTHLNNLQNAPVRNPDGSISTLSQTTVEENGKVYNLPSVWDGAHHDDPKEIIAHARKIGLDKFPSYWSEDEAEARYQQMHNFMERDLKKSGLIKQPPEGEPHGQLQKNYESVGGFLSGLKDAFKLGARGTLDAAQEDIDAVKAGKLPAQTLKALQGMAMLYGSPGGVQMPIAPAMKYSRMVFDPEAGWQTAKEMTVPEMDPLQHLGQALTGPEGWLTKLIEGLPNVVGTRK